MSIQVGDSIPSVTLRVLTGDDSEYIDTASLFQAGKVVMFSLPGAFTPTCSARHLPGFIEYADRLKAKGVSRIVCLAVNDPFVMRAWAEKSGVGDKILMLPDGNAEFTKAMGMTADMSAYGLGVRGKRFVLVAENGKVTYIAVEQPGQFDVSSASAVLAAMP